MSTGLFGGDMSDMMMASMMTASNNILPFWMTDVDDAGMFAYMASMLANKATQANKSTGSTTTDNTSSSTTNPCPEFRGFIPADGIDADVKNYNIPINISTYFFFLCEALQSLHPRTDVFAKCFRH